MHRMPTSTDFTRRVLLALAEPTPPTARPTAPQVRHYRLARVRLQPRFEPSPDRFAHLRRSYD
jgi:hypothetical protein